MIPALTYRHLLNQLKCLPDEVLNQKVLLWDEDEAMTFDVGATSVFDASRQPSKDNEFYINFNSSKGWN